MLLCLILMASYIVRKKNRARSNGLMLKANYQEYLAVLEWQECLVAAAVSIDVNLGGKMDIAV